MRGVCNLMKALGDENRLRIVAALEGRELCLCQVVELLGLAASTVSRHLAILDQADVVRSTRQGRWTYFRLAGRDAPGPARQMTALVQRSLRCDPQIVADAKRLKQILKSHPVELCRKQTGRPC